MNGLAAAFIIFIIIIVGLLVSAWFFMLFIGAAHAADDRIPALGFSACVALVAALRVATAGNVNANTSKG